MNKQDFLLQLQKGLSGLPREDAEERLTFYSEMIDDRVEEGRSEEEAVGELGEADALAAQIIADTPPDKARQGAHCTAEQTVGPGYRAAGAGRSGLGLSPARSRSCAAGGICLPVDGDPFPVGGLCRACALRSGGAFCRGRVRRPGELSRRDRHFRSRSRLRRTFHSPILSLPGGKPRADRPHPKACSLDQALRNA